MSGISYRQYHRADGLTYVVAPDGTVFEFRPVALDPSALERATEAGMLTRGDDFSCPSSASPALPAPRLRRERVGLRIVG